MTDLPTYTSLMQEPNVSMVNLDSPRPNNFPFSYQKATLTDLWAIIDLERRSFDREDWCSPLLFSLSFVSSSTLYVAKCGRWVIGHMLIVPDTDYPYANEIFTIAVALPFRNQGIAMNLVRTYETDVTTKPILTLQVRKSNVAAQGLYRSLGFEFSEVLESAYPDGENGWVYTKRIVE